MHFRALHERVVVRRTAAPIQSTTSPVQRPGSHSGKGEQLTEGAKDEHTCSRKTA